MRRFQSLPAIQSHLRLRRTTLKGSWKLTFQKHMFIKRLISNHRPIDRFLSSYTLRLHYQSPIYSKSSYTMYHIWLSRKKLQRKLQKKNTKWVKVVKRYKLLVYKLSKSCGCKLWLDNYS